MLDDAKNFMSTSSAKAVEFSELLEPLARKYNLAPPDNSSVSRLVSSGKSILTASSRKLDSASSELAKLQNLALRFGNRGEGIRSTAMRLREDGDYWKYKQSFESLLDKTTESDELDQIDLSLRDVSDLMMMKPGTYVMVSNGGTIDVNPITSSSFNVAGGPVYDKAGVTPIESTGNAFNHRVQSASGAPSSVWWKAQLNHNTFAIGFYFDGTNALSVSPQAQVVIPAGVPQGRLVYKGNLHSVGSFRFDTTGGTDIASFSGFDLNDTEIEVSDGVGTMWTWDQGVNEGYRYQRRINKAINAASTQTVTVDITGGSAESYCVIVIEVLYKPDAVMLSDLDSMNVDIDDADPISRHIELVQQYNQYLTDRGHDDMVTLLNARLGTNYSSDVIYPTNWNSTAFDSFSLFIEEYCLLMQNFSSQIKSNIEFLRH
jgi:hypothetical protein